MPTGYTAPVADGTVTTLRQFALQCARGMGALVTMRDDAWDAPIPEKLEPDTSYHEERLAAARARFDELVHMTPDQRRSGATAWNAQNDADKQRRITETTERRNRYNFMIAHVIQWNGAPAGIKDFMLEQLHSGRDFDCPADPCEYMPAPQSIDEWYAAELKESARAIEYNEGERAKEIARTAERNAWLEQLRASLPPEPSK